MNIDELPLKLDEENRPLVSFKNVTKSYGDLTVLDSLNLDIKNGEIVSVIGPSGSGKTTVLRMLMTLETINGGVIYIDGEPLTHMEVNGKLKLASKKYLRLKRRDIGMCFQSFNLFPHMSVLKNCIESPIHVLGLKKDEAIERVKKLLDMVGMIDKIDEYPSRLSGGQQQRVAIARALAMQPKVLLLDEVTSALDPEVISDVTKVIRKLASAHNLTIIMVTHQMEFAREISDRVCFFCDGKIEEQGDPKQIFDNPKMPRTQQFLKAVAEDK